MNLRDAAIFVVVVLGALVALGTTVAWSISHSRTGEDAPTAKMVAQRVSQEVLAALSCNNSTISSTPQSWTVNNDTVQASTSNGQLQITVTTPVSTYTDTAPLWTSCQDAGATLTATGAH